MIGNIQSSSFPRDISHESLKSYLYLLAIKYSTEISNDFDYSIPDAFKPLILESAEFIRQDSNNNNSHGLTLLTEFHQLFLKISRILKDIDREDFLQLFVSQQSQLCPSQRFIDSIKNNINFGDQPKVKIALNHSLSYYLKVIEKYQKTLKKELLLLSQSSANNDLVESFASTQLIQEKIVKEILVNSLIGFFGKRDDNPFLCLNGTITRLTYAKSDLETPLLFEVAVRDIVEKETSKTVNLIEDRGSHIHLPTLFLYLLCSDNSLMLKIDQFFKICIPAVELRQALEFIKEFPERLNSSIAQNIENIYENIIKSFTLQQDRTDDKYEIALKFLDNLNVNLGIENDDEKIKIQDFLDEMSDSYEIYHDPAKKKQIIELINAKYLDLLARKSREFAETPSFIDANLINHFREFPCDLFYEDSSVLDSNKINNLINLINPQSTENANKKIALIILGKIVAGYKMSFKKGDIGISSSKLFLYLYFDTFLEKFQEKYQVDFISYVKSFQDLDSKSYFPQEIIDDIIKFNQNKGKKNQLYTTLFLPTFQLGIAKVNLPYMDKGIDEERSKALNLIIAQYKLTNPSRKDYKKTIFYLIKFGQEDLIDIFFDHGFFEGLPYLDVKEFLKIAINHKNNEALLIIFNLIKNKIPEMFDINPWSNIAQPSIENNFIGGIEAIESLYSKDELQSFFKRYSFLLTQYALIKNNPEALKTILTIFKKNGIDPKNTTLQLFLSKEITWECDSFSFALVTKKDKLFKILIENHPSEGLLNFILQRNYFVSDSSLNLLELSCHFDSENVFKILFELLKKNNADLKNIIEEKLNIKNLGLDLNLFLYALQKENEIIFKYLTNNYPKDKLNEFLESCLKKIITQTKHQYNILEYACINRKEKMLKMLLELLQENEFDLKEIIGKPKNKKSKSLLLIGLLIKDNDAIFKILLDRYPSDLLIDFLEQTITIKISGDQKNFDVIELCSHFSKKDILILIFNKIAVDQSANLLKIFKEYLEKSQIVKDCFNENPILMIFPFLLSIRANDQKFLLDFIYKYPTDKILYFLKQTIKSDITGAKRDLDLIEYCCLSGREDILHLFFRKISLFQPSKLAEIYNELLEANKNVKDFLRGNTSLISCLVQEIIVSKNNELLSKFFNEYPDEKIAELLLQSFDYPHDNIFHKLGNNLLTLACKCDNDEAVRILIDKCPKDKFKDFFDHRLNDEFSLNAFSIALVFGGTKLIKVLLEKRPESYKEIELLENETIHSLEELTENNISVLRITLGQGNFILAEFLINKYQELTDRDPEKLLEYLKKINNRKETILHFLLNGFGYIDTLIEYSSSQPDQKLSYEEIKILKSDPEKQKKFIDEKLANYLQKILDKIPIEKIDGFVNYQNTNHKTALNYYLENNDYEPLELSKKLILHGAIINYPSAKTTSEDKSRNMAIDEDFLKKKYAEKVYKILNKIFDFEISQEKITNPVTFSNLLFLKAIADSKEFTDEQKLAAINKLIEKTTQDKRLADLILEEYEIRGYNMDIDSLKQSFETEDNSSTFLEFDLDQDHKSALGSDLNEKNQHMHNLEMSSNSQVNLTREVSIKIPNLLNPDEKGKMKLSTKALLVELAKKVQKTQHSHDSEKKRKCYIASTQQTLKRSKEDSSEKTPKNEELTQPLLQSGATPPSASSSLIEARAAFGHPYARLR